MMASSANAQIISTYAGNGTCGNSGDWGPATAAEIFAEASYRGIAVDLFGDVYIASGPTVRKINNITGEITRIAGISDTGYFGDGGFAVVAKLSGFISHLAVSRDGTLYINYRLNNRIRKIDASGIISTYAGNGTTVYTGDGVPATATGIVGAICLDTADRLIIATQGYIIRVEPSGILTRIAGNGSSYTTGDSVLADTAAIPIISQIVSDRFGNLYYTNLSDSRVCKLDVNGYITTVVYNAAPPGYIPNDGDGGPASAARVYGISGVAVDSCGNVFFSERTNHKIRVVTPSGYIYGFAGVRQILSPGLEPGKAGYEGDGGLSYEASISYPNILSLGVNNKLYFFNKLASGSLDCRLRKIAMPRCDSLVFPTQAPAIATPTAPGLYLWPNPTTTQLFCAQAGSYLITDMLGRQVMQGSLATKSAAIDVSSLPPSVYSFSLSNGATVQHTLFVKQ